MFLKPLPTSRRAQRGSAIMIALFVIVIMALLAAAMGRFLVDSGEKNTVEVRGVRALMAAQSGLEIALYRLYPNGSWNASASGGSELRCVATVWSGWSTAPMWTAHVPNLPRMRFGSSRRCGFSFRSMKTCWCALAWTQRDGHLVTLAGGCLRDLNSGKCRRGCGWG